MSPFRIALSFAIAGLAVYQGIAHPDMRTVWFTIAAVAFVVAVYRLIKFSKSGSQRGSGTENQH